MVAWQVDWSGWVAVGQKIDGIYGKFRKEIDREAKVLGRVGYLAWLRVVLLSDGFVLLGGGKQADYAGAVLAADKHAVLWQQVSA